MDDVNTLLDTVNNLAGSFRVLVMTHYDLEVTGNSSPRQNKIMSTHASYLCNGDVDALSIISSL